MNGGTKGYVRGGRGGRERGRRQMDEANEEEG